MKYSDLIALQQLQRAIDSGNQDGLVDLLATQPVALLNHERPQDSSYLPPLLRAIARGDLAATDALLAVGARLDIRGPHGRTPLMQALVSRHPELAKHLWRLGADPLARTDQGTRVVDHAMACGDRELIERLLALGEAFDGHNQTGRTSLHFICQSRDPDLLDWALQRTAFGLDAVDDQGMRPLELSGSLEVWRRAQRHRPDLPLNIKLIDGDHSIHRFALRGASAIVLALLDQGVDVNLSGRDRSSLVHYAAASGNADLVRQLVQRGARIESRNRGNLRALHWAASRGHADVVEALISLRAKVEVKGNSSFIVRETPTPLALAAGNGHLAVARLLLAQGADPDTLCNSSHETALVKACFRGDAAMVDLLLAHGASPNGVCSATAVGIDYFDFPLARAHSAAVVERLLAAGADINASNRYGETALHWLAEADNDNEMQLGALEALLGHGADPRRCDMHGRAPQTRAGGSRATRLLQQYSGRIPLAPMSPGQAEREDRQDDYRAGMDALVALATGNVEVLLERARGTVPGKQLYEAVLHCQGRARVEIVAELLRGADRSAVTYVSADSYDDRRSVLHRMLASLPVGDQDDADWPLYLSVIDRLLQLGAQIDAVETLWGDSPMHSLLRASERRQSWVGGDELALVDLVGKLIRAGAPLDLENEDGCRPLDLVRSAAVRSLLRRAGASFGTRHQALFQIIEQGDIIELEVALADGVPIESRAARLGDTPFLFAARCNAAKALRRLADLGANPDAMAEGRRNAWHLAATEGALDALASLSEMAVDGLDAADERGRTPIMDLLDCASGVSDRSRREALRNHAVRLTEQGARVDMKDADGRSVMDRAGNRDCRTALRRAARAAD